MERQISEYLIVKNSKIHSTGVFAAKDIPKGIQLIEYKGDIVSKEEGTRRAEAQCEIARKDPTQGKHYVFELDDEHDIDGNTPNNDAKYVNHSCDPNCSYNIIAGHIWYSAAREIKKGEELTFNYGFGIDDEEDLEDMECRCGSPNCLGYIIDQEELPKLQAMIAKKK